MTAYINYMIPFYAILGVPGTLSHLSDFNQSTIRAGTVLEKLDRAIDFAEMLEHTFSEGSTK